MHHPYSLHRDSASLCLHRDSASLWMQACPGIYPLLVERIIVARPDLLKADVKEVLGHWSLLISLLRSKPPCQYLNLYTPLHV